MPEINENLPAFASIMAPIEFIPAEAAVEGETPKKPRVKMKAYNGGVVTLIYWGPTAFELSGIKASDSPKILYNHIQAIGHLTSVEIGDRTINAIGVIDMAGLDKDADKVIATSKGDDPFPWDASIGVYPERNGYKFIAEGESATVNGKDLKGPFYLISKGTLREISIVEIGADAKTQVSIAAKGANMPAESKTAPEGATGNQPAQDNASAVDSDNVQKQIQADRVAQAAAMKAAETSRQDWIKANVADVGLAAEAIEKGWDEKTTGEKALAKIRENRPVNASIENKAPGAIVGNEKANARVYEVALLTACGSKIKEGDYTDQEMQTAHTKYGRGGIGLKRLVNDIAEASGYNGISGNTEQQFAFLRRQKATASTSTIDLSGVLGNTANKMLESKYVTAEDTWRCLAKIGPAGDYKETKAFRPELNGRHTIIDSTGAVPHASLTEIEYTNRVRNRGVKLCVTTEDMDNDDTGVFMAIPNMMLDVGIESLNHDFWTIVAAASAAASESDATQFFNTTAGNYIVGSTTTLTATGYGLAQKAALSFTRNIRPIVKNMTLAVVPPTLYATAFGLYNNLVIGGNDNAWAKRYDPQVARYLEMTAYGNSALKWLIAEDARVTGNGPLLVRFKDGQQIPTVKTYEVADGDDGIGFTSRYGYGISLFDQYACVLSKGAA